MGDVILKVENVSKLYRLGTVGTGTFGGDVQRFWKTKILGQEDPFLKVGQTNDRTSKEKAEFVWALRDINFEVKRGEVLGIIGKNGAGKSTLLKLLSRITSPTTGSIKSAGRMASLLEVGTGFHPELTGRENIFLNGAILGMTKKEIQSKFDEIVDFSGCELYIDTPTKRYSSGMTVRLGFAVAAFLDPEILVVDEVLAVGDAEFQKKAIGKMQDVSRGEGKTVLFVSHNMESISRLCSRSLLLNNGKLFMDDMTSKVIEFYYGFNENNETIINKPLNLEFTISTLLKIGGFRLNSGIISSINTLYQGVELQMSFSVLNQTQTVIDFRCNFELINFEGLGITSFGNEYQNRNIIIPPGKSEIVLYLVECVIKEGSYTLNVFFQMGDNRGLSLYQKNITTLNIRPGVTQNKNWRRYIYATQHGFVPINIKNIIINPLN